MNSGTAELCSEKGHGAERYEKSFIIGGEFLDPPNYYKLNEDNHGTLKNHITL